MRALVSGGTGFIGSNNVRRLLDKGHKVAVLDRLTIDDTAGDEAELLR